MVNKVVIRDDAGLAAGRARLKRDARESRRGNLFGEATNQDSLSLTLFLSENNTVHLVVLVVRPISS